MSVRTLFDKVWSSHVVAELSGGVSLLAIDRHLLHDLEGGQVLKRIADRGLREGILLGLMASDRMWSQDER